MQTTFVILKPDTVMRGLVWEIIQRFERKGLKISAMKMTTLSTEILKTHYAHLVEKPFFPSIVAYMQSAPVVMIALTWVNAVQVVRTMVGVTNPVDAAFGTIRGDFAMHISHNCIHASENADEAVAEVARFFDASEIMNYDTAIQSCLYE
jgi:nucleoside-diphosphate kinase